MIGLYLLNTEQEFREKLVGEKVTNLIPFKIYTPEFIVLSTDFYSGWKARGATFLKENNQTVSDIAKYFQQREHEVIILRSSCTNEDMRTRGKYHSTYCKPNVPNIINAIEEIYQDFDKNKDDEKLLLAVLIQVYYPPKIKGHLSNERRVSESKMHWLVEEEIQGRPNRSNAFTVEAVTPSLELSLVNSLNYVTTFNNLKKFAAFFSQQADLYHIEWVWDGVRLWLVQVDHEPINTQNGARPGSEWKVKKDLVAGQVIEDLEVLETIATTSNSWRKIECVKTFMDCGLPYWPIYILENSKVIAQLITDEPEISLVTDLKKVLAVPIVIRTETTRKDLLAPRTDTVFTYREALNFLRETTQQFIDKGYHTTEFCFLIHQFIPSTAGALSFTKPNTQIVRIDSIWGIVEGLYYHPYDSFEFNKSDSEILKKIRCKSNYIDVDVSGVWYLKRAGANYDWAPSLSDEQVKVIAQFTQTIAKHIRKPVNVMFFVNKGNGYPEILPWFYSDDEITNVGKAYDNFLSVKNKVIIRSIEDFDRLKKASTKSKKNLFIDLNIKLLRKKDLIEDIADFAKTYDYTVDIKGSMLSHPYYVFYSRGVNIRCIDPFKPDHEIKKFYKLVRDKIPTIISSKDEAVQTRRVAPEELLSLLKTKMVEEANEYKWARTDDENIEEMSDVLEVLRGACKLYGLNLGDLEEIADEKREKRGGFEEGIVLVATQEQAAIKLTPEQTELFAQEENVLDVKKEQTLQMFKKGDIDNFKTLTEVNRFILPYVNNLAPVSNVFRYPLKDESFNSVKIEYSAKGITLSFEVLTENLKDPGQLPLFPDTPLL